MDHKDQEVALRKETNFNIMPNIMVKFTEKIQLKELFDCTFSHEFTKESWIKTLNFILFLTQSYNITWTWIAWNTFMVLFLSFGAWQFQCSLYWKVAWYSPTIYVLCSTEERKSYRLRNTCRWWQNFNLWMTCSFKETKYLFKILKVIKKVHILCWLVIFWYVSLYLSSL